MDSCARDTTDDLTRSFRLEASSSSSSMRASTHSRLAPMSISGYGGVDDESLQQPRSLGGSVPVAKLASVVGGGLLVVALGAAMSVQPVAPPMVMAAAPTHPRLAALSAAAASADFEGTTPALGGVDVVAFYSLEAGASPVPGSGEHRYDLVTTDDLGERYESTFFFSSAANRDLFAARPGAYLPRFGGFCAFGITSEMGDDAALGMDEADPTVGWPWSREHMGPPTDTNNWVIKDGKLYFTFLPEVMGAFLDDYETLAAVGEKRWAEWYGEQTTDLPNGPMQVECMASGYGPPVTRTCTLTPQRSSLHTYSTPATNVDEACLGAAFDACGAEQGNNPGADNACSDCLSANFETLAASCPSTDTALHNFVDKTFCW